MIPEYLQDFLQQHRLPVVYLSEVKNKAQALLNELCQRKEQQKNKPLFVAINGSQGSGKSTFASFLQTRLINEHNLNTVVCSLDDFYLTGAQRQQLAKEVHPLLSCRGVPGTHNTALINEVFTRLSQQQLGWKLPKFDKSTDEPRPTSEWPMVANKADVVIFEGWCWGVPPQSQEELIKPVNNMETKQDPKGIWRGYVNQQLAEFHQPLYQKMDYWIMIKAPSFNCIYQWRLQQEDKLRQACEIGSGKKVMTDSEVHHFIQHFQRLTEHGFHTLAHSADFVIELDSDRRIVN